ncbi:hypothetical protein [Salinispora sp. H7-4]|uniref:hypothetical protein n=1 Tax=Salinispora sp. H7-4 TaxID=2748321 RepID=UPI0015D2BA1D|nr:hypothetical protein [Salinispora sp. H7-4]NYT96448.1 hypothetical protein [Salinispora sp. H7-4]
MTTSRPAQLAPVRIGRGRAAHLGCRSSITGPTCQRAQPRPIQLINATLTRLDG